MGPAPPQGAQGSVPEPQGGSQQQGVQALPEGQPGDHWKSLRRNPSCRGCS